jgi:aarF domain-containing kinase
LNFKAHLRSANRLKDAFCKNGGAFIKVGQYIGSLDYLLPYEYVSTMKTLHDKAPQSDIKDLYETIEADLNCKVNKNI